MRVFQKGFNYSQDGFGNRLVYHLQGCSMSCPWCANPEGLDPDGVLMTEPEWLLDSICPRGAIREKTLDRSICADCSEMTCITSHRNRGLRFSCEEIPVEELVQQAVNSSSMFYDNGGVTFTGGEATLQFEELTQALRLLGGFGIHTALETNASHPGLAAIFPLVDQLIVDCKLWNDKKHREAVGVSNAWVIKNIRLAARQHPCLHIRVPLIGGVNDGPEDRQDFFRFFETLKGENVSFEVLKYHEFGKKKWEQCGLNYAMKEEARVSDSVLRKFREEFKHRGLKYMAT